MTTEREVVIDSRYRARKQFRRFHRREQRWAILVCHRRAGKTVATLNDLIIRALQCPLPRPRYAFVFPQRNQAKDATWAELKNYTEAMWGSPPYENELRVELLNGATIRLYGADNPDALRGAYFDGVVLDEFSQMPNLEINKDVRVHTAWDLGISDSTAIWFIQCVGRERRLLDYYEASGVGLDHYVQVLQDKRMQHGWTYGDHYLPHDIVVKEFTSGKSRRDTLAGKGIEATIVPASNVLDGINVVRRMLGRVWIDPNRCERGIEALRQYRREWSDSLKDWSRAPLHDSHSHGADALRTFACGFDDTTGMISARRDRPPPPRLGSHWSN
jgi:hypothetical protein